MAGTVADVLHQAAGGPALRRCAARIACLELRMLLELTIHQVADCLDDPDVGFRRTPTDVPRLSRWRGTQNEIEGPTVVMDVEPVADLQAIAIDRQWPPFEDIHDAQRQELLGKLV